MARSLRVQLPRLTQGGPRKQPMGGITKLLGDMEMAVERIGRKGMNVTVTNLSKTRRIEP